MANLSLAGVKKSFGPVEILHGIDIEVASGQFCVFVGPSGCGKSTLLRLIAGLEEVSTGTIAIDDRDVTDVQPAQRGIAMVFQSYALYPHMDVFENMAFGLKRARYPKAQIEERVSAAARKLRIEHLLPRRPRDLSGGQRQRVAIGRAIVREPLLFLFDEPLSNLDATLRVEMRVELAKLKAELGATIIYVTHDQVEAMTLADRIVVMRDGRIEQDGAPLELYRNPVSEFVAGFIGSPRMNFLPVIADAMVGDYVRIRSGNDATLDLPVDVPVESGTPLSLGVRPEHLLLGMGAGATLVGELMVAELLGGESYLHVKLAERVLVVKTFEEMAPPIGTSVTVRLPLAHCHLFNSEGRRVSRRRDQANSATNSLSTQG